MITPEGSCLLEAHRPNSGRCSFRLTPRSGGGCWSRPQAAADAGQEGGFMGFGAERVSAGEQRMLQQVRAVLGMA